MRFLPFAIIEIGSMPYRMGTKQFVYFAWIWWTLVCGVMIHEEPMASVMLWGGTSVPIMLRLLGPDFPREEGEGPPSRRVWWAWNGVLIFLTAGMGLILWKAPLWLHVSILAAYTGVLITQFLFIMGGVQAKKDRARAAEIRSTAQLTKTVGKGTI